MKKQIIFDMDGVLLDSEPLYMDMNQHFFRKLGAEISIEEHHTFVGISATKMWTYIKEKYNLSETVERLKEEEKKLKFKMLQETDLFPNEGIIDFLEQLKHKGYTMAVASSSLKANVDLILSKLNLRNYFDLIISGEQVTNGKPAPDIFLKVATYYSCSPQNCIVIEDSTNGILAAKSAGMTCIGYYNLGSGKQDLSRADLIIDNFNDKDFRKLFN